MGDGTKENPFTREDVLRLIEENGGTAKGLDLSGKMFEKSTDLRQLNLRGVILKGTYLWGAHLERASLRGAHLERANLKHAHLERANLGSVHLEGANLGGAQFSPETRLGNVHWGNFILGEERSHQFGIAAATYRRLKQWYTNAGIYDIAGEFFFREMTAQRKGIRWWPHPTQRKRINWWIHPRHRAWSKFVSLICGYGERPLRVIGWAASVVLISALIYFIAGSVWEWSAFWNSLYFSAVSFTALGYGSWLQATNDWIKGIGAFESFVGVFTIALFLITFIRKMTR